MGTGTPIDTLFAAINLTDLQGDVVAVMITLIGIGVCFMGFRYIRKLGVR
ncbi:MAG: hypothetical protein P4M12_06200 [Gammaproteobacteria bacterium]|nr:hypothetical protein [Gammaproteobacteria bacterium]